MTVDLTQALTETFTPRMAIVVHKSTVAERYYLESHNISEKGEIMEGRPLQQQTIQGMVDIFFDQNRNQSSIKGLLPENLLQYTPLPGGYYKMVWFRPAEKRVLHFKTALKIPTGEAWVPPMIYAVSRKNLNVFALRGNARPKEGSKLFRAPFHNVSDEGHVCLGNAQVAKPKERTFETMIKYWEDLFWLSEFSHVNGENPTKSLLDKVWIRLIKSKGKIKWADLDELIMYEKLTLKDILK